MASPDNIGASASFKRLRQREEDIQEAVRDASLVTSKVALAFGSDDFAIQVGLSIELACVGRDDNNSWMLSTDLANNCYKSMLGSIRATEAQLALPPFATIPTPPIPPTEFNRNRKLAMVRTLLEASGRDPSKAEEVMASIQTDRSIKSSQDEDSKS
jgi:hypothetical protein